MSRPNEMRRLSSLIDRLQRQRGEVSNIAYEKVANDYASRLALDSAAGMSADDRLDVLIRTLRDTFDELSLRTAISELSPDAVQRALTSEFSAPAEQPMLDSMLAELSQALGGSEQNEFSVREDTAKGVQANPWSRDDEHTAIRAPNGDAAGMRMPSLGANDCTSAPDTQTGHGFPTIGGSGDAEPPETSQWSRGSTQVNLRPLGEVTASHSASQIEAMLADFESVDLFIEFEEGDDIWDDAGSDVDRQVLNELFFNILTGYLDPIVFGFRTILSGERNPKLVKGLMASIRPMRRAAAAMGFEVLTENFVSIEDILSTMLDTGLSGVTRIGLTRAYDSLRQSLPANGQEVGLTDVVNTDQVNTTLLAAMTKARGLEEWMLQVLVEVGVNTKKRLFSATPNEIQAVTGLTAEQSKKVLQICRSAFDGNL